MDNPLVSVILPVYNAQDYLKESIDCILNQSYKNLEFIIINDGSKDNSEKIILSYSDPRIKYVYHDNRGLAETLNVGLSLAIGKYIARQDQDDISLVDRIKKQVEFLEKNPTILLVGTHAKIFSESSSEVRFHNHATHPAILKFDLLFDNPFVHSSVMFRKKDIDIIGDYNTDRSFFEDFELWSRFSQKGSLANLGEVLVEYRHHDQGLSKSTTYFKEDARYIQSIKNIENLMGYKDNVFNELTALYHWDSKKYKGYPKKELFNALKLIADKINAIFPNDKNLINERFKQYKKIIGYRLNINQRRVCKNSYFKLLFLKIENKLFNLQPHVKND